MSKKMLMNGKKNIQKLCSTFTVVTVQVLTLTIFAMAAQAEVVVKLQEPKWEFLLQNPLILSREAELPAEEGEFAREIQPLLADGNHNAVLAAFSKRPLENDSAALRLLRGQILLSLQRPKDASVALQAALQLMPDLALAHRSLAMAFLLQEKNDQASTHLARSIELGLVDAQIYGQLAYANLQRGLAASSVAGYQQALFLQPDNPQWRQGLLFALINSQAYDQAQGLLDEMLKTNPDDVELWLQRGQIALNQSRPLQALSSLEYAFDLGNKDASNLLLAAQLHMQEGSPLRAVELLSSNMNAFVRRQRDSDLDTLDQMAGWLANKQLWRELNQLLNSISQSKLKTRGVYGARLDVYRAQLALHKGQRGNARKSLERALRADPANGEALLALASLLREQNRSDAAVTYYVRAEAIPKYTERAQLGRAQLEIDRQNYKEALRVLRKVARANPARADVMANVRSLQSLIRNQG